jgi:fatty acid desaturase
MVFGPVAKMFIPLQSKLYYIIMGLARCNLYVQSYLFLLRGSKYVRQRIATNRFIELGGLLIFAAWFGALVFQLPSATARFGFFVISHTLAGILHVQITLSHFSMATYHGSHPLATDSFIEHQLKTCLDIDCPPFLDFVHGGLQFQLPHHLFPRIPRCNLRRLRDIIARFCLLNNLEYSHTTFLAANKLLLNHLSNVSDECKLKILDDIFNARG